MLLFYVILLYMHVNSTVVNCKFMGLFSRDYFVMFISLFETVGGGYYIVTTVIIAFSGLR